MVMLFEIPGRTLIKVPPTLKKKRSSIELSEILSIMEVKILPRKTSHEGLIPRPETIYL